MDSWYKPLSFGQLLDRSFQLYRKYFVRWVLFSLLMLGPFYVIYGFMFADMMVFSFDFSMLQGDYWMQDLIDSEQVYYENMGAILLFMFIVLPFAATMLIPVAASAVTIMTQDIYNRQEPGASASLKRTMKRFGPLFGNSLLYLLIAIGIYIAIVIALVFLIFILAMVIGFVAGAGFGGTAPSAVTIFILVLLYIALILGVLALVAYFLIRLGFFIPLVVLEGEGIGFGRSWNLTKGSFWRLFFAFLVLSLIMFVINTLSGLVIEFLVPGLVLKAAISVLISIVLSPLFFIIYAVAYLDLQVRREGLDLENRLGRLSGNPQEQQNPYPQFEQSGYDQSGYPERVD